MKLTHWDEETEKEYRVAQILEHFKVKLKLNRLIELYKHQGRSRLEREIIADRLVDAVKSSAMNTKSATKWLDKRLKMFEN